MVNDGRIERVRLKFERDFTQIPNEWLRDAKLSLDARGLLALLMSHDAGFVVSVKQLIATNREGRAAIDRMLRELKQHGYLEHELLRRRGRIEGTIWRLTDPAEVASQKAMQPQLGLPDAGKPGTRLNRHAENQHLKEAHSEEQLNPLGTSDPSTRAQNEKDALSGDDPVDAIWKACPVSKGEHRFEADGGYCLDCAQVHSDGRVFNRYGTEIGIREKASA